MSARAAAVAVLAAGFALAAAASAAAPPPRLSFRVFSATGLPLSGVTWTGSAFVYSTETIGEVATSGTGGSPVTHLTTLPRAVEEVRCVPSPGAHGFAAASVFCHDPRGGIWELRPDGTTTAFATLPETGPQDGALVFDTHGAFGYALLASTGGSAFTGGSVYALDAHGSIRKLGSYPGPGGADNIELAPARFGSASSLLLLAIDQTAAPVSTYGALFAMKPDGSVRRLLAFPEGLNPIVVLGRADALRGAATPGLYVADTNSKNVYLAAAAQLRRSAGSVFVGTETTAHMWLVSPAGAGFRSVRLRTKLGGGPRWNLEGAAWVG